MKPQYILKNDNGTFYFSDKKMTKLHREDGPAIERPNGTKSWYLNGKLHREDGPAIERPNGTKFWYLNSVFLSEQEHALRTKEVRTIEINVKRFTVDELNALIDKAK
jgi:hypothetical protein